jgi:hypothetical protein
MVNNLKNIAMLAHALVTHNHVLHVLSGLLFMLKSTWTAEEIGMPLIGG